MNIMEYLYTYQGTLEELENIKYALDQSSIVAITDKRGIITYVNDTFCKISKYSREELIGKSHRIVKSGYHSKEFFKDMWSTISSGHIWKGQVKNKAKDGTFYWVDTVIVPLPKGSNNPTSYVSIRRDITEQKEAEQKIYHLAYHDPLTNLLNRRGFHECMEKAVEEAKRQQSMFATIFIDLDRFKHVNDTLGHKVGDELLETIARRMTECIGNKQVNIFRIGGDEFTVIWSGLQNAEEVEESTAKILDIFKKPFAVKGYQLVISPSIGVSIYPVHGDEVESLLRRADTAMYCAKEEGENHYKIYTKEMEREFLTRLTLEQELHRALNENGLHLHYQPKVDVHTGQTIGMEALLRWHHPEWGVIPPDKFIPVAENTGLIIPLGEWVLRTACQQNKKWQQAGYSPFVMSVNMSTLQFKQENLVQMISEILSETGLEAKWLELEITESIIMEHAKEMIEKLSKLKAMGIHVSIDDFGTGYSSFNYLKNFPIDVVKIDRSFVRELPNSEDIAIVSAIISMAHALNLKVLAEGVETKEQWEFLRQKGCHEGQGYLFSKPLAPEDVEKFLLERK
jgi:diguanylate cyclase (GGDEF)-like protein/PAS domain S-box-containing protein